MTEDYVLEALDIVKLFGGLRALDGATLRVPRNKITLLIGPNGSGKTTLLNVIAGVYKPDGGKVLYEGEDITGLPPHKVFDKGIARSFQIPHLFSKLAVLENSIIAKPNHPGEDLLTAPRRSKWFDFENNVVIDGFRILRMTKLSHLWDSRATALSGGQMKLLEVARVLLGDKKMVLMDEPTAGVNPTLALQIFEFLRKMVDELGYTMLIIEHRLDIAAPFADYAYAMAQGKVISEGSPEEVMNDPEVIKSYLEG
ncbi:MAG: ABC transporter ATP-binding protein [Desulfurococcales archaeon]|nr:ABC transporter ATP-binding protein [Desulfurococcales archaeon]